MFAKLAKVRTFDLRPDAVGRGQPAYSNDNRPDARLARTSFSSERPTLVCRWQLAAETGRLECHWEVEPMDTRGRSAGIPVPGQLRRISERRG
jgi:hypothetical protein